MTDSMVESVARAICVGMDIDPDLQVTRQQPNWLSANRSLMVVPAEHMIQSAWKEHRFAAIKAIEAMREPTEVMALATGSDWGAQVEDNWHKMIDAALLG